MTDFKHYKRKLIQLNRDTAALIHIFKKDPDRVFEDMEIYDEVEEAAVSISNVHEEAAQQFFDQLEGHWSIAFCKALRDKCNELIAEDKKRCDAFVNAHEGLI